MRILSCILALCCGAVLPVLAAKAPVPARIKLKNGAVMDGELLTRDNRGWVFMRAKGSTAEIGVPKADLEQVDFELNADERKIPELLEQHEFATAARELGLMLDPTLVYLDLPTNLGPWVELWIKTLHDAGQFQELRGATVFLESLPDPRFKKAAALYRALARLGLGFPDDAEKEARAVGPLDPRDELAPLYFYVRGSAQLARGDRRAAQESAATIVVYQPKNLDWLPAGLSLSVNAYLAAGDTNVARQVINEIRTIAPRTRWSELAGAVEQQIGPPPAPPAEEAPPESQPE